MEKNNSLLYKPLVKYFVKVLVHKEKELSKRGLFFGIVTFHNSQLTIWQYFHIFKK